MTRLRGNLATRPFYNERLVRTVLTAALAAVVAWSALNAATIISLSQQSTMLRDRTQSESARASAARTEADRIRRGLDATQLKLVSASAAEANALIQRRTFSWTALFNELETTLPADVRLVQVQPQTDADGRLMVSLTVVSRDIEDLDEFIGGLEATHSFTGVVSRTDEALEDGTIQSNLQGYYAPAAKPAVPTSEPGKAAPPAAREGGR